MPSPQIEIVARDGGREIFRRKFSQGEYIIGREPGCAIELILDGVSREHAKLIVGNGEVFVEDLASVNGTRFDGQRIKERMRVAPGVKFQIGIAMIEWLPVPVSIEKMKSGASSSPEGKIALKPEIKAPPKAGNMAARGPLRPPPVARAPGSASPNPTARKRSPFAKVLVAIAIICGVGFFLNKSIKQRADRSSKSVASEEADANAEPPVTVIGFEKAPTPPTPAPVAKVEEPKPVPAPEPVKMSPPPTPAPMAEAKPVTPKPADDYPGVPALTLSPTVAVGDPDFHKLIAAAKWSGANGKWDRFHADLKNALVTLSGSGSSIMRASNIERMLELNTPSTVFAQERFIRAVGESVLTDFTADRDHSAFIEWLFARPAILTAFDDTIQPQDKPREALQAWWEIWRSDEAGREEFANLAIACALVFDEPVRINPAIYGALESDGASTAYEKEVRAHRRYLFFRDSAKRGVLRAPIAEMTPRDLVWVVDAPVPESELIWAQKHMTLSRMNWSKAYGMIRYRMDRATQGVNPYKAYTLAEILKEGGICGDQAYFAAMTAKANGIPAMVIGGEGDRGGHAWFGYKVARNAWNLTTGRYADNYAAGSTTDPQTHQTLKEHELRMFADPVRRTDGYVKSEHLVALAKLLGSADRADLAAVAIDDALKITPKHLDAWFEKLAAMRAAKIDMEDWKRETARMRTAFHGYSDVVQRVDKMETDYIAQQGDYDAARKLARRDAARMGTKDKERTDLILDGVFREADLAEQSGDAEKIGRIYRDAMREKGNEVVAFKKIAQRYYQWGKNNSKGEATVRDIIGSFERKHKEPTGDVFAIGAYRGALGQLVAMAKEQGMTSEEHLLERRETKLKNLEEKLGKEQSKNAGR